MTLECFHSVLQVVVISKDLAFNHCLVDHGVVLRGLSGHSVDTDALLHYLFLHVGSFAHKWFGVALNNSELILLLVFPKQVQRPIY